MYIGEDDEGGSHTLFGSLRWLKKDLLFFSFPLSPLRDLPTVCSNAPQAI